MKQKESLKIAFDFETTGLLRPEACELKLQSHAIELYLCKFTYDGKIHSEFETFIKPPVAIPEIITKITGIDDNMVKDAPEFIEIYDDLVDFVLGTRTIFAHNCAFDIEMLKNELRRHGLEFNFPYPPYQVCTVEASFAIENKRLNLQKLNDICGAGEIKDRHRAKGDVIAMVEDICWLKKEGFLHEIYD